MQVKNQTVNRKVFWCLCGIFFVCFGVVLADELAPGGSVALELLVETETGRWKPVVLDTYRQAPPGRLLMVSVEFRVPAESGPESQTLTLAVPDWLEYQMGSAVGPGSQVLLSFNGGLSFGKDHGAGESQEFAGARASHIRWIFSRRLPPEALGQVRYRAIRRPGPLNDSSDEQFKAK